MVLAPRSWPSRPGLATTTRYGRFTNPEPYDHGRRLAPIAVGRAHCGPCDSPQLRSPLARAVVPGARWHRVLRLLALVLWGIASLVAQQRQRRHGQPGDQRRSDPARSCATRRSSTEDGPVLFPDLLGTDGDKSIVLAPHGHRSDERLVRSTSAIPPIARSRARSTRCSTPTSSPIATAARSASSSWRGRRRVCRPVVESPTES